MHGDPQVAFQALPHPRSQNLVGNDLAERLVLVAVVVAMLVAVPPGHMPDRMVVARAPGQLQRPHHAHHHACRK